MHSWDVLDPVAIKTSGDISNAFVRLGALDYRAAARFISRLPYGRNTIVNDRLVVIRENRGTCSTKHAILRRLAIEQAVDVALVIGIYAMHERNTPALAPSSENMDSHLCPRRIAISVFARSESMSPAQSKPIVPRELRVSCMRKTSLPNRLANTKRVFIDDFCKGGLLKLPTGEALMRYGASVKNVSQR